MRLPSFHRPILALALLVAPAAGPADAANLFALTSTGEVFVSANQGVTWTIRSTVAVSDAVALQARLTSSDLFMASASGSIYHSFDSGMNWSAVGAPPVNRLVDMTIRGDGDIVLLTATGDVYGSDDLGATFAPLATLTASNFTSLAGRNDGRLFALTRTGEVYRSDDGGGNWFAQGVIPVSNAVRIRSSGATLFVLTSTGDNYRSTDSGATWTAVGTLSQVGTAALVVDDGVLVAATREGHVATSPDGTTWTWRGSTNQLTLTALDVDTPTVSGVGQAPSPGLHVGAPWPNPARGGAVLSLSFTLSASDMVTIGLVDAAGRLVANRTPEAYGEGSHTMHWDADRPRSGVYFVRLSTARGPVATRRWVVTR